MHIVDVTMLHAPASGGVRTYLDAKHRVLATRPGLRTSLLVPGAERSSLGGVHTLPAPRIPLGQGYRFPLRRRPWRDALMTMAPDLIEAGDPYVTAWAVAEAGQALGVPTVGFFHSDLPRLMGDRFGTGVRRRLQRYVADLYGRFDSVLAPCTAMAERLADWGIEPIRVQPLGVDLELFHPRHHDPGLRLELGLRDHQRLLVFAGRCSPEKHVDVLLATMARLGPAYHLLLMGPGMPTRVPANVSVVPRYCPPTSVARALASADAMLHAGTRETFGLVAQEAMACGVPVVAARSGALKEYVPLGAGVLCRPRDPDDMARAVHELFLNDPVAMGRHARRHVERHFRWEHVIDDLSRHYAALVGDVPPAVARADKG
ncbi:glycosyltransferase [Billgrantia gudaonensis]|uniref:Alpha-1,6-mannosyltransferase n=1 Tax=Billgrantia gudaonensis TaxID=376427 RepID=A0A1G8MR60_9GAMM|nr:glycosyltransferase [Halomonas gudaonensis]SDI70337.1 alpha-1,6-mannosyltransferase [Halomonas gudaonensis]